MKAKKDRVNAPKGFRLLRKGEVIRRGDMYGFGEPTAWRPCTSTIGLKWDSFDCCPVARSIAKPRKPAEARYTEGSRFYQGIEYFSAWLVDNVEGLTITEEPIRRWAVEAWKARGKK